MAAYASLISLMRVIDDLEHHPSPPISLDKQIVDSITQRITYFQEFLHSYSSSSPAADIEEEVADPLEMRIAGAAFAAEDAIEFHIVDCIKKKKNKKKANDDEEAFSTFFLNRCYGILKKNKKNANDDEKAKSLNRCYGILQSVIEEMDSIKKVVIEEMDSIKQKIKKVPLVHDRNVSASVADRSETFVGSDGVLIEIMEKLDGGQLDFQIIPIVGMGGIGKTFLAKTIYTKPLIKEHFDICSWATISQNYDTREILCELLFQATNKEQQSGKSVDELGLELRKYLFGRRFLIVMDDMWSIDSWDQIQRFFPNNGNGSRVLVTTRLSQLSSQLTTDYSLSMSFLDKASSWDMFSKTVFGENSSCPPELEEIGEKIVDNCRGLPLSISVVGGLLKTMEVTRASWESIRDNFTSVVNMRNDKHCLRLLKLSYNHLPVYLKPCFLYMGVFEEDKRICVSTLVRQWVSEGFLKPTKGEELEITGRGFLQDLVSRNLILIDKLGSTGSIKYCKIHDLVRDMCLKEGQKEGFYHVMGKCNPPPPQGMNAQRRVIIPNNTLKENDVRGDLRLMSHTRSIICEYGKVPLCKNLVLLRTLQVDGKFSIPYEEKRISLSSVVSHYVNLRHVAIAASRMPPFFPSISHLWNLRTLVVSYSFNLKHTIQIVDFWEMTQLRHMNFSRNFACLPDPPSCDGREGDAVAIMENLHTLKGIRNFKFTNGVVKRIPNIKKLGLVYNYGYDDDVGSNDEDNVVSDGDVYFLGNMKYLCGLEFLTVYYFLKPFTPFQKITYPHSLKKLSLRLEIEHEWDDMLEKIGSLPLLEKLELTEGCFGKGMWEIGQGQFPCLKYLKMDGCRGLENWSVVEEDSSILPRLEHLHLYELRELKKIPLEIGNIDTLKSIELKWCGQGVVKSVKEMFDEQVDLQGGEDQLSFHVKVRVTKEQQHLMSLASSNFYVNTSVKKSMFEI